MLGNRRDTLWMANEWLGLQISSEVKAILEHEKALSSGRPWSIHDNGFGYI